MSSYAGRHAELYDLFYADKPYGSEAAFVHECLRKFGRPSTHDILEIACGTGSHAFELEKFGYRITASDYSESMIDVARRRATEAGSKVRFVISDMKKLAAPAEDYDAVICLFDSIGYLKTNAALAEALAAIGGHLRPNGIFVFEFWHAPAMLLRYSPVRVRKSATPQGEAVRISETTLEKENRLAHVDYTIYELKNDGTYSTFRERQTNRYFFVDEMRQLISDANLEAVKFFAGFEEEQPIDDETWHIVAVARQPATS